MATGKHPRLGPLPVTGTSNDGVLPLDLLYDILLRLPAKPLCRFRAVCTSWRSLLCHRDFIAAHRRCHSSQRIAVGICGHGQLPCLVILDMESGRVVKRVSTSNYRRSHKMRAVIPHRAVGVLGMDMRLSLMDFATGAISLLPDHAPPRDYTTVSYTVGRAAPTGEYKVLAIAIILKERRHVCKILTLGGGGNGDGGQRRWRGTGSPPCRVVSPPVPSYNRQTTVVEGVAYFLVFSSCLWYNPELNTAEHDWIMAFSLDTEAWRPDPIQGPTGCFGIGLGGLDGHLVACHDDRKTCVELWYLVDPDQALWSMLHQIVMPYHGLPTSSLRQPEHFEKPLAIMDDGRILVWMRVPTAPGSGGVLVTVLRVYDPRTGDFTDGTRVTNCHDMGVHTWSMLYFGRGADTK
jgi:hypothetical protein